MRHDAQKKKENPRGSVQVMVFLHRLCADLSRRYGTQHFVRLLYAFFLFLFLPNGTPSFRWKKERPLGETRLSSGSSLPTYLGVLVASPYPRLVLVNRQCT
ncbi:uncharacterized protein LY79DRAFT_572455 [Colletotrichum navitas]|uniref:Transmembrane protein n=1 Tax=Colletotrichum navitas TaxID=681940 RepID=A0AAD8UYU7_9PEZI|nr:uncharacterized protein LY79DRAFT_572455 [Colletotrichum navitas]KAK1566211.1 hypothetical protein LY79DRAFT_572455 [Colletotrichum navitas]